jgi:hypothetical protein
MPNFFCSESSRQAEEDIIGSGTNYQTYVLIECPLPWAPEAFDSPLIPDNLKNLVEEVKQNKISLRFLLIASNQSKNNNSIKVLIYEQSKEELSKGYDKQEFNLEEIEQVAAVVRSYLSGEALNCQQEINEARDILICTHGSHDKCCAKYGNPFYTQAVATVLNLNLSSVRIWKSSHFGGHRFAPTAIDFPDGRYYGVLDSESFQSILTRTGDIKCLNKVYRGWGILPNPIQFLERELMLQYGWDWFNYKVSSKLIQTSDLTFQAKLTFQKNDNSIYSCHGELVKNANKTLHLRGSCCATQESEFVKYSVENTRVYSEKRRICIHKDMRNVKIIKGNTLLYEPESFVEA